MPNGLLNTLLLKATKFSCFLWSFLHFFGDFFEVVLQATSAMFVTNFPRGYTKVGFCYSQTKKKFEHVRNRGDFVATNRHEIAMKSHVVYTGDLESPQKSPLKSSQKSHV